MRSYRHLIISLALILSLEATAALRYPLVPRQDDSLSSESSRAAQSTKVEPSLSPSSVAPSNKPSVTKAQSQSVSPTPSGHVTITPSSVIETMQAPVTATFNAPSASTSAEADSKDPLPIHPRITPAMGLTGAILMFSGLVYMVIGIKNKWLYVSFSAAYLAALAVTVLIVYLMSPPVSNAVQGAFFVAAFLSGLIFGAVSLVFPDISDGLGCLLGGFCLSMWFLTLKKGGLIPSTTGRAIFISCMSAACFSLSFSHYTRTYGLIFSIAFAGATIAILGVDCYSRAGLKEFWMYLWNLNSDAFPLNTDTYPMTKGIRVELASIVILGILGIVSQLRPLKLIKERREQSAVQRLEREQHLEREEEALGRKIEDDFSRERAQWEATYGDKHLAQDSVIELSNKVTPKTSTSTQGPEDSKSPSAGLVALSPQTRGVEDNSTPAGLSVTATVLPNEDEIQQIDQNDRVIRPQDSGTVERTNALIKGNSSTRTSSEFVQSTVMPPSVSTRSSIRSSVSPSPVVVPLPFPIPKDEDSQSVEMDNASVSAVPESVHDDSLPIQPRFLKRLSGGSELKRSSKFGSPDADEDALMVPHFEDDYASSVAANLDDDLDDMSLPALSRTNSPIESAIERESEPKSDDASSSKHMITPLDGSLGSNLGADHAGAQTPPSSAGTLETSRPISPASPGMRTKRMSLRQSLTISTKPKSPITRSKQNSLTSPRHQTDTTDSEPEEESENSRLPKSIKASTPSVNSRTESQVRLSKDILPEKMSRVALSYRTNEWAKHLELAEKPEVDELPEAESPDIQLLQTENDEERPAPVSNEIRGIQSPPVAKVNSKRGSSGVVPNGNSRLIRSISNTSLLAPGMSSPAHARALAAARLEGNASPPQNSTLMGQREALVRGRVHSLTAQPLSPGLPSDLDQENMTLAQRKQLMKQQKPPSASQKWQQNHQMGGPRKEFNSHQPRRSSGAMDPDRREVMLANWRESMKQEAGPRQTRMSSEEVHRAQLMDERRQKEVERQQRAMAKQQRESMMDSMMRSGGMLDAHREAMRKMQAKANRSAS